VARWLWLVPATVSVGLGLNAPARLPLTYAATVLARRMRADEQVWQEEAHATRADRPWYELRLTSKDSHDELPFASGSVQWVHLRDFSTVRVLWMAIAQSLLLRGKWAIQQ
jgi:hypothetical protein